MTNLPLAFILSEGATSLEVNSARPHAPVVPDRPRVAAHPAQPARAGRSTRAGGGRRRARRVRARPLTRAPGARPA